MALNPAAADISSGVSPVGLGGEQARGHAAAHGFVPRARQGPIIDLRHTSRFDSLDDDVRGGGIADGLRRNIAEKYTRGEDPRSSSGGFSGDYWDGSLAVFSISAFEAQLYVQAEEGFGQPRASYGMEIQAYQDIKTVLERARSAPTDADDVFARKGVIQQVSLLA